MHRNSDAVPHGAWAGQRVGARHARPARERTGGAARGSAPAAQVKRDAFDQPCAPWRAGGVGTRGVPTHRRARRAASNKGRREEGRQNVRSSSGLSIGFLIPVGVVRSSQPAVEGEIAMSLTDDGRSASSRGVGPAGVGVSAKPSSSRSRARRSCSMAARSPSVSGISANLRSTSALASSICALPLGLGI